MRLYKISHKKLTDKEKMDLLSGKIIESKKCGKIRILTKEEEAKFPDPFADPGCIRVWEI